MITLQPLRERLTLLLIALLPLHAFLVTVSTRLLAGPDHAPFAVLAIWKEGLLGLLLLLAFMEGRIWARSNLRIAPADALDWLIVSLVGLGILVSLITHTPFRNALLGFRYDFIPLIAFLILRRVPWSDTFQSSAMKLLIIMGTLVAALGLLSFFLPQSVFRALGYADLHSLYQANGPLAPFQQVGSLGLRRIQSTMSGPNQLGIWLLIPLGICLIRLRSPHTLTPPPPRGEGDGGRGLIGAMLILLFALALTFSRSAWLGALVMVLALLWLTLPRAAFWRMTLAGTLLTLLLGVIVTVTAPGIILRATSNAGHVQKPLHALQLMTEHPLGLGLGSAGPASNRTSDTCVELPAGADWSWAQPHPDLCVFVDGKQVQPTEHVCHCPLLTENWYLQLGVEMGWLGTLLFMSLIGFLLFTMMKPKSEYGIPKSEPAFDSRQWTFLALLGISTAALTLHAWEDSAVAYTAWMLLATVLKVRQAIVLDKSII